MCGSDWLLLRTCLKFLARDSIRMLSALCAIALPSVRLSVTRVKTVEVRIV